MRKVLEDLYFGNIVPYEKRIAAGSELRHLVKRMRPSQRPSSRLRTMPSPDGLRFAIVSPPVGQFSVILIHALNSLRGSR